MSPRRGVVAALASMALVALSGCLGDEEGPSETSTASPDSKGQAAPESISELEFVAVTRTLAAIESGQPLPHDEDGVTFHNREGLLPERPDGYYREYTVETPGSEDRGARRLVIGEGGETFYTRDHYQSFVRIQTFTFDKLPE